MEPHYQLKEREFLKVVRNQVTSAARNYDASQSQKLVMTWTQMSNALSQRLENDSLPGVELPFHAINQLLAAGADPNAIPTASLDRGIGFFKFLRGLTWGTPGDGPLVFFDILIGMVDAGWIIQGSSMEALMNGTGFNLSRPYNGQETVEFLRHASPEDDEFFDGADVKERIESATPAKHRFAARLHRCVEAIQGVW